MTTVNVHEAKTHLSRLIDRASAGEEIILSKAGKPKAKLVPLESATERISGRYQDRISTTFFDPLPEEELGAWES
jgi:prevent-host-death family protein